MRIAKFGGSSVKDAQSMQRCAEIVSSDKSAGLVIISATFNTTNQLEEICESYFDRPQAAMDLADKLMKRHISLAQELELQSAHLEDYTKEVEKLYSSLSHLRGQKLCSPKLKDLILSWGEKVSSLLFSFILKNRVGKQRKVNFLDACDCIITDSSFGIASVHFEQVRERCKLSIKESFDKGELFVTQGFIGKDEYGHVTTLGREGSDYSAALFGAALAASEVHIWTDVDGIYQCDPNIISEAKKIPFMSYDQATTMAKSGAKVLFGKTLSPLRDVGIPVYVRSSLTPKEEGTLISSKSYEVEDLLSITVKKRSDGVIVTLIGADLDLNRLEIEQGEIDRGEGFRSFFVAKKTEEEVLNLWYSRYFSKG